MDTSTQKLLRVTLPGLCAVALLSQHNGAWTVTNTAPSLSWMRNESMDAIKQRLLADGASWEWLPVSPQFAKLAEKPVGRPAYGKRTRSANSAPIVESRPPASNGERLDALWLAGSQNAIRNEERDAAMGRNRKKRATKEKQS